MRAQLVHLSGPFRGKTTTYPGPALLIGTNADAAIRYPPGVRVEPRHAEIRFVEEGCCFYLRALDGPVFVNRKQVEEVILEPDDLIEIGIGGPKARFRSHAIGCRPCKPVRVMLRDARDVRTESGVLAVAHAIGHDLMRHSSGRVRVGLVILLAIVGLASGSLGGWIAGARTARRHTEWQRDMSRRYGQELAALQGEMERFLRDQAGHVSKDEFDRLRDDLAERSAFVDDLVARNVALRRVLDVCSRGVGLVHGVYGLYAEHENTQIPVTGPDGDPFHVEYLGSAFLVSDRGHIVTNRHVAEPWWNEPNVAPLIEQGLRPAFVHLAVCFPDKLPAEIDPSTVRLSEAGVDIAVMRVDAALVKDVPALPLRQSGSEDLRGDRVILLGYPTGLNALLARAEADVVTEIWQAASDTESLVMELARRRVIAPIITQGSLNQVLPRRLVYDAETTSGGSGGPVFGPSGTVIGVNFAVTREFTGSNFGVPIRFVVDMLEPLED